MKEFIKKLPALASKHSPTILTGVGIAGMITTTVLAVAETPKAMRMIEDAKKAKGEELTKKEVMKTTWKCYIPDAVTGVASIACLIGSNSVSTRRNAALATAYQIATTDFQKYKEKTLEVIGEKKEKEIHDAIAKDKIEQNPVSNNTVILTGKGQTLCYDAHSDRYFKSDIDRIKRAMNNLNYRMTCGAEMYISLNEFYDEIGLKHTDLGDDLGWQVSNGLIDIHFGAQLTDDEELCVVIEFLTPPEYGFNKLY